MAKTRILIVEDEFIIAKDLKSRLERLGYEIPATVPSGDEAVKKVVLKPKNSYNISKIAI